MTNGRVLLGTVFIAAGVLHFVFPAAYLRIMPPYLPAPRTLVLLSGACEIAGGAGLLVPATRRSAAWGLVTLLFAVSPANVQMALDHAKWQPIPAWALWLRVPLQIPLIVWAWRYTRARASA